MEVVFQSRGHAYYGQNILFNTNLITNIQSLHIFRLVCYSKRKSISRLCRSFLIIYIQKLYFTHNKTIILNVRSGTGMRQATLERHWSSFQSRMMSAATSWKSWGNKLSWRRFHNKYKRKIRASFQKRIKIILIRFKTTLANLIKGVLPIGKSIEMLIFIL